MRFDYCVAGLVSGLITGAIILTMCLYGNTIKYRREAVDRGYAEYVTGKYGKSQWKWIEREAE